MTDSIELHFKSKVGLDMEANRRKATQEQLKKARLDNPNCDVWLSSCGSTIYIREHDRIIPQMALWEARWDRERKARREREKTWRMQLFRRIQRFFGIKPRGLA